MALSEWMRLGLVSLALSSLLTLAMLATFGNTFAIGG
jgi:hypothetical protein